MGGLGLNLGAVQKNEEPKAEKTIPQGFALKMPVGKQQPDKIPSLNIGLTQNNRSDEVMNSGSHSSKRDGVGRLNLDKAVAYQQKQLVKNEQVMNQAKVKDIEESD